MAEGSVLAEYTEMWSDIAIPMRGIPRSTE
ncbi:hypothetical protein Hhis01_03845 [Haloarcula hispanica]